MKWLGFALIWCSGAFTMQILCGNAVDAWWAWTTDAIITFVGALFVHVAYSVPALHKALEKSEQERDAALAQLEWQPVEIAPKELGQYLVQLVDGRYGLVRYSLIGRQWVNFSPIARWLPIPPINQQTESGETT